MNELVIFVLCYNRPKYIQGAIDSILQQTFTHFDLILSDNSTDDSVQKVLKKYRDQTNIKIIRRQPSLNPLDHFNKILVEAQTYLYFMMFHDDDLMLPPCVEKLVFALKQTPQLAASSCNAFNKYGSQEKSTLFNPYLTADLIISDPKILVHRYLTKKLSHTAFPFYIYNSKLVAGLKMSPEEGGKHCDVTFLCKVTERGPIYWYSEPLAVYRRHASNDSNQISLPDLISLSRFIIKRYKSFYFKLAWVLLKRTVAYCIASAAKAFRFKKVTG